MLLDDDHWSWLWLVNDCFRWSSNDLNNLRLWLLHLILLILVLLPADATDNNTKENQDNHSNDDTSWAVNSVCVAARSSPSSKHSWLLNVLEELVIVLAEEVVIPFLFLEIFNKGERPTHAVF